MGPLLPSRVTTSLLTKVRDADYRPILAALQLVDQPTDYPVITLYLAGESRRIVAAGGFVESGRVNGSLALSRALGDFEFKTNGTLTAEDQIVTGK